MNNNRFDFSIPPKLIVILVLIVSGSFAAYAQTERAQLVVNVTDAQGAVVVGATVTLLDPATQRSQTAQTNDQGQAIFPAISAGTYEVSVSAAGFPVTPGKRVAVQVGAAMTVDFVLGLAPALRLEVMEVRSMTSAPNKVSSADQNELLLVPNLNNDLTPLLQVVPGAIPAGAGNLGRVIIDGKGAEQQTIRFDGFDATPLIDFPSGDPVLGVLESFKGQSVTALDQVASSVFSKAFSPIYGPGVGSITESVTKSGTNDFQFNFYNVGRNDRLDARNYFDYDGKNGLRRNQFGGKFGGPLIKDRLFFYLGYEGIRGRIERNVYEAVPAAAVLSSSSPLLRAYLPPGTVVKSDTSLDNNFLVATRRARTVARSNAFDARFDFLPPGSQAGDDFFVRITRQTGSTSVPDGITGREQLQRITFLNAVSKGRWTSGHFIHEVKVGLNLSRGEVDVRNVASASATDLGSSLITIDGSVNTTGLAPGFGSVPIATLGGQVKGIGNGSFLNPHAVSLAYNLTRSTSDSPHTINIGAEIRFIRLAFDRRGGITYKFPNTSAFISGTPSQVTFVSDLNGPGPFGVAGVGPRHAAQEYYTGYFQDEWAMKSPGTLAAANKLLKLTYGIRFDYFGAVRSQDGRSVLFDPETGSQVSGTKFYSTRVNVQPRIGISYELPFQKGLFAKSKLQAGFGLYSGIPRIGDLLLPVESDRFNFASTEAVFPSSAQQLATAFFASKSRQFQPLTFSRDFVSPERAYKWNVGVTRNIPTFADLTFTYFGNVGRDLPVAGVANPIVHVQTNADPTKDAVVVRKLDIIDNGKILQPFGEFSFRASNGRSHYEAFSVQVERTTANGWPATRWLRFTSLKSQYTLSRNVGNASGAVAPDFSNLDADFGYNAADVRHSFSLTASYKIWMAVSSDPDNPTYKAWNFLRGWALGTTISARSGLPLIIRLDRPDVVYLDAAGTIFSKPGVGRRAVLNTPVGGSSGSAHAPSLVSGVNPYLRDDLRLLNPLAFTIPPPGQLGNLRRGSLRGPGLFQLDLSFTRYILDSEKSKGLSLEFKAEFFNVLNHANFGNPTATLPNKLGTDVDEIQPGTGFTVAGAKSFGVITTADPGRRIQFSLTFKLNKGL